MKFRFVLIGVFLLVFLVGCATNKNKELTLDNSNLELAEPIPVGSARVEIELISLDGDAAEVKVLRIIGYGSSASRILVNDTIEVNVHESVMTQIDSYEYGDTFETLLRMQASSMNQSKTTWTITEIYD